MGPAEIGSIVLDEESQTMEVAVAKESLAQAIGKNGQNVRLCSQITGWKLNVIDKDAEEEDSASINVSDSLKEYLDVDDDLAQILIEEGFDSLDKISNSSIESLSAVEEFDEEIAEALIDRAKEALLTLAMEISTEDDESSEEDIMAVEGVDMNLALELSQKGIKTRDDLAELSVDELKDLIDIEEEQAGTLIMKAREHWF